MWPQVKGLHTNTLTHNSRCVAIVYLIWTLVPLLQNYERHKWENWDNLIILRPPAVSLTVAHTVQTRLYRGQYFSTWCGCVCAPCTRADTVESGFIASPKHTAVTRRAGHCRGEECKQKGEGGEGVQSGICSSNLNSALCQIKLCVRGVLRGIREFFCVCGGQGGLEPLRWTPAEKPRDFLFWFYARGWRRRT